MILLLGVLALSWRLSNDTTTHLPVSQTPLAPSAEFTDDDSYSEAETGTITSQLDEEATLTNGEQSAHPNDRKRKSASSPGSTRIAEMNDNGVSTIARLRRGDIIESEEIWEELDDDTLTDLSPSSRFRRNARSRSPSKALSRDQTLDKKTNESTTLLARFGTGRSYRNKRRRRSALVNEAADRERRRWPMFSREVWGGWWKINWWNKISSKGERIGNSDGS